MAPKQSPISDEELVERWRAGDDHAATKLVSRHWASISRFFATKAPAAADDLVQATFLTCVEKISNYRGEGSFRAFLFGIARFKLLRYLRIKSRDSGRFDPATASLAMTMPGMSTYLVAADQRARLEVALRELPLDTQLMLELYYWERMTVREIAGVVEQKLNTVKCRMRRGRLELAKLLDAQGADRAT